MTGMARIFRHGFSLVELSVVICVVALVVGFGISMGGNAVRAAERVTTQQRLEAIKNALDTHFKNYGYLPCPYDRTLTPSNSAFGVEARPALGAACATSAGLVSAASATVLIGGVPVRALGLPDSYAADAWNNKFTYGVSVNMTTSAASYYSAIPAIQISAGDRTGTHYILTTEPTTLTPGTGAAYIVISHGHDGRGAYPLNLNSIPLACGSGAQNDVGNCNDSAAFYDTTYNDGTNDSLFFDDYVVWGSNAVVTASSITSWACPVGNNCEAWCAPCGGTMPNIPAAPAAFTVAHLCAKIVTSSTPCVATCIWSGKLISGSEVVRCP